MSFHQLFILAINELKLLFDLHPRFVEGIKRDEEIRERCMFVYEQLTRKQLSLLRNYKKQFNANINRLTKEHPQDDGCGFVTKCFGNGYKKFCNLSQETHNSDDNKSADVKLWVPKVNHQFQKKNMNHMIDQKYQGDMLTIYTFTLELMGFLMVNLIQEHICAGAKLIRIDANDKLKMAQYDGLVRTDENYFRLNRRNNSEIHYYESLHSQVSTA